ncbi:type II secretion system minor pseudopilin GspK [Thiohalobacter sp.]|uniref:type II secretion system minor pseudopilin GspK n=1 Tax=Thiohalobacter sp. TaxID=2025948 RepID=UPI00260D4065|nr:type II secretion system minor pseudopilin GspK [Thiohalobacter sp.]
MAVPAAGRQSGVALLTALLVVALATLAAVAMATRQHYDVRRTANQLDADQAAAYAAGVEDWARVLLRRDLEDGPVDHLDEDWARELPPLAVTGGQIAGRIEDLEGRFNLNNLLTTDGAPDERAVARFRRLLELLELDPALANAVLDWMDADLETRFPGGAEDDRYSTREPPYRAANAPFASVSELRLVEGFDAEAVRRLRPYLSALPGRASVNVNTAPPLLLQALFPDLSAADAEALVDARSDKPFDTVADFLAHDTFAGRAVGPEGLATGSGHFAVFADVRLGTARARQVSVLERQGGDVSVRLRSLGGL